MDKFKKFFKDKKVDKHFKRTGPGARLTDDAHPSASIVTGSAQGSSIDRVAASDVAAQAAFKRLYKNEPQQVSYSQKKIQMLAQRELEEERKLQDPNYVAAEMEKMGIGSKREPDIREYEHSDVIESVFYTCELLGDDVVMKKQDIMVAIEDFLKEQMGGDDDQDDNVIPSVLLLYSLNKKAIRETAVETIGKYIQNILENPMETKFRRIRVSNKAYQERVVSAKGACEFLAAIGFSQKNQPLKEGEPEEPYLVMSDKAAEDTARLIGALEALREGQSVPIKVSRSTAVFLLKENQRVTVPKLSSDFFDISSEEVKREQQAKSDDVNRMLSLRTKEMRERDEKLRQYKYKYTLLRIRFPDRYVLQGTFGCYETLDAVRQFVLSHLSDESQIVSWVLRDPMNGSCTMEESKSLAELGLAPAAVLHLDWQEAAPAASLAP